MDRFTRFKVLRALWARAKNLLAWLVGPREREERLRMQRWLQINIAERHLRDGMIRGTGDPDSYVRPAGTETHGTQAPDWQAQWHVQRAWFAAYEQYKLALLEQQQRSRNGRR
jgi:hypothetical protein